MIAKFFLKHPILSIVISIVMTLAGLVSLKSLAIEQYPNITPPQIQVTTTYPGASSKILSDSVASPLEDQINGVEDMIYMYSQNAATGNLAMSIYFKIGADIDQALNNVQDRVELALSSLPEEVQKEGIVVKKETPTILLIVAVGSEGGREDEIFTSNYATIHIADTLLRLPGVSDAKLIGPRDYSMRVWLEADKMAQLGISTTNVIDAINEQSTDYPIGELGNAPTNSPVTLTLPVTALGRLTEPEQFDQIILRATEDGATVRIKDIGHTVLGAEDYTVRGEINGKNTVLIAVYQEYGANALSVAESVKSTMQKLSKRFPPGITYSIPYDTTKFIQFSIHEVEKTLYIAAFLVSCVIFIFLQNIRATIIPVVAMIVSIVGAFSGIYLLGFSLNTLTLFGLVLAIGIVVDDAIVVVENVERNIREKDLSPQEAALVAMEEVASPIIAIVCVLCAVFIPIAFLGGIAGALYKQFAMTLSVSVVISGIVALSLSPVLAAFLLKKRKAPAKLGILFDRILERATHLYVRGAEWMIEHPQFGLTCFVTCLIAVGCLFRIIPTGLVPNEDQGYLFTFANLPEGSSLDRTTDVTTMTEKIALQHPAVDSFIAMTGFSLLENINRTPIGTYFITLKDWSQRKNPSLHADAVAQNFAKEFYTIPQGLVLPFNPPAIQGLGTVGGFEFWILNEGDATDEGLELMTHEFMAKARQRPEIGFLTTSIESHCMQLFADLDRTKARALNVPIGEVYQTLQSFLGSIYVNNFNKYGHVFKVMVQAGPEYRSTVDEIGNIYVKSTTGAMVPIKSLVNFNYSYGPNLISRFNTFPAARINGIPAPGFSASEAFLAMQEVADEVLPLDMEYAWGGEAYQEITAGGAALGAIAGALVLVFLILAALYERWSLPFVILLAVPFGILGALLAIFVRGLENDVYFQIGLVTLIALAAKNAILIVEFAVLRQRQGKDAKDAALEAARQRFRAILMTSFTFILGVLPLVMSSGAGAASRHSVGTGVFGGMIAAVALGISTSPSFYTLFEKRKHKQ